MNQNMNHIECETFFIMTDIVHTVNKLCHVSSKEYANMLVIWNCTLKHLPVYTSSNNLFWCLVLIYLDLCIVFKENHHWLLFLCRYLRNKRRKAQNKHDTSKNRNKTKTVLGLNNKNINVNLDELSGIT